MMTPAEKQMVSELAERKVAELQRSEGSKFLLPEDRKALALNLSREYGFHFKTIETAVFQAWKASL